MSADDCAHAGAERLQRLEMMRNVGVWADEPVLLVQTPENALGGVPRAIGNFAARVVLHDS